MELGPYGEADSWSATQEFTIILWNPKHHRRVYKSLPTVSILSQINPVHSTASYPSKLHFNIFLQPMFIPFIMEFYLVYDNNDNINDNMIIMLIQESGFDFRCYQIFWVVGLERGPLSLVSTIKELLEKKVAVPV
jgi:hypothetical protein